MKLTNLKQLFQDELKDLYSAESQLIKALPKMAKAASSEELQQAFKDHLEQTRGHVNRLQRIGEALDVRLTGKKCKAMEGLIKEGKEAIDTEGEESLVDLALVAAAQRVEHYEISAYGSARAIAEQLDDNQAAQLLQETLDEEAAADKKLTSIAEELYPDAKGFETENGHAPHQRGNGHASEPVTSASSRKRNEETSDAAEEEDGEV